MQVYVTGSAGKIGREAVKALRAAGHEVTGVDLDGKITSQQPPTSPGAGRY